MNGKILLVVLLVSISLAACIEGTGPPNATSSPQASTPQPTVTISSTMVPTPQPTVTISSTMVPTPTPTPTPVSTSTPSPGDNELKITTTSQPEVSDSWPPENPTRSSSPSYDNTTLNLESGKKYVVTVMEVIEGDAITVMFPEGGVETVKLLGVEVPRTEPTNNQPHVYNEEIMDLRCLADIGKEAKSFVNTMLVGENCSIELDQSAGLRENGMLLCYVYNDEDFNKRLLEEGYASVSPTNYSKKQEYMQIQNEQAQKQIGLWECGCEKELTSLTVGFFKINNAAMNDDLEYLNNEYIILKNYGNSSVDLYNWSLTNSRNDSYNLTDIIMYPGSTITLHSGSGVNTAGDYYLSSNEPIWDNQHDSAYLYNSEGKLADYCRW